MNLPATTTTTTAGLASGTYTIEHIAELLCCSTRHVRRLDAQRAIPGRISLGRLVRFSRRQVDAWLNGEVGINKLKLHR